MYIVTTNHKSIHQLQSAVIRQVTGNRWRMSDLHMKLYSHKSYATMNLNEYLWASLKELRFVTLRISIKK